MKSKVKKKKITPISPDLENYSPLDKNKVEIIEKQPGDKKKLNPQKKP